MTFEILGHLRFRGIWSGLVLSALVKLALLGTIRPISGMGLDGMGWLSSGEVMLRAPTVLITNWAPCPLPFRDFIIYEKKKNTDLNF